MSRMPAYGTKRGKQGNLRPTGINVLGGLPWGSHICAFYETKEDLLGVLIPYFKAGLENNEFCLWIVSQPLTVAKAVSALRKAIPQAGKKLAGGQIEIVSCEQWYRKRNQFDQKRVFANWLGRLKQGLDRGFEGLRASGDTIWVSEKISKKIQRHEQGLGELHIGKKMLMLCTYSLKASHGGEIFDAARTHHFAIARRHGHWERLETPELKQTKTELAILKRHLEKRVRQRTVQLTTANEKLKLEIAERKRAEALLDGQKRVLEMMAADAPLSDSLKALVRLIEGLAPGMLGSILLLDDQGLHVRHGAAPSLPSEYSAAIDGRPIGPHEGCCGTAAYCKTAVFVRDIATDPLWKNYRPLALKHGLRACWSTPIIDARGRVLGTFAMYYRRPALPKPEQLCLIEIATHIAAIAISSHRSKIILRESEAKLKEAQRLGQMGYWERDLITGHIIWSEETYRIFGLKSQDPGLNQTRLEEMIHPDDRLLQRKALAGLLKEGRRYDVEYRIVRPGGEVRFVHVRDDIIRDNSGRPTRTFGTVQDITGRKRAEALLHAQAQEIKAIVDTSPDVIVRYDRNLRRTFVNPAAIRILGKPKEEVLGKTFGSTVKAGAFPATMEELSTLETSLKRVFDTGRPFDVESTWPSPTDRRNFVAHFEPEFDTRGELTSVLLIARDITSVKEGEAKLRQAEAELARMARLTMMGELTASIAHEVNQPLAAVVTNANAVSRWLSAVPHNIEEALTAAGRIDREGRRASEVIKRIRALFEKHESVKAPVNLNQLIQETIALMESELDRKEVTLQTSLAPDLPQATADRIQLQQVLLNLMVNAIESLSAVTGSARVLRVATASSGTDEVLVAVHDTGTGLQPKESDRIFEPFYTTKSHGLGMGLSLSRSIVESHGGRLWVTPNEGAGVTFQFTLPIHNKGRL